MRCGKVCTILVVQRSSRVWHRLLVGVQRMYVFVTLGSSSGLSLAEHEMSHYQQRWTTNHHHSLTVISALSVHHVIMCMQL